MPILTYCVSLAYHFLDAPTEGVGGAMVYELEEFGLRAWYSEVEEGTFSGAEHVTQAALAFHHFVAAVFREGSVLPFRFPTILESVDELHDHLEAKAAWYTSALRRSEGLAQFEARVVNRRKAAAEAGSGTEYLEERKRLWDQTAQAIAAVLKALEDFVREHHVKESQQGTRVYFLVDRTRIAAFRETAAKITIPDGFAVRLSGPWPPTEFLAAESELE